MRLPKFSLLALARTLCLVFLVFLTGCASKMTEVGSDGVRVYVEIQRDALRREMSVARYYLRGKQKILHGRQKDQIFAMTTKGCISSVEETEYRHGEFVK